jgi:hypothetical protein
MARKLVITTFEDASVREQVIELYGFNDKLTDSDYIMAARINPSGSAVHARIQSARNSRCVVQCRSTSSEKQIEVASRG